MRASETEYECFVSSQQSAVTNCVIVIFAHRKNLERSQIKTFLAIEVMAVDSLQYYCTYITVKFFIKYMAQSAEFDTQYYCYFYGMEAVFLSTISNPNTYG